MNISATVRSYNSTNKPKDFLSFNSEPDYYAKKPYGYLHDSEYYQIRGEFMAEVIANPEPTFYEKKMSSKVINDLRAVTMRAFEKPMSMSEIYAPDSTMAKNILQVDYLTIIRNGEKIVAFGSQTMVHQNTLYLCSAIVDPAYATSRPLGTLINVYIWTKILKQDYAGRENQLNIIARTRNKNVATLFYHCLYNVMISGDRYASNEQKYYYQQMAEILNCKYNNKTGILKDVYPSGLPSGGNVKNNHVNSLFTELGSRDAYFISGNVKLRTSEILMKREVKNVYDALKTNAIITEEVNA
jgi:hypothetical protein